MGFIFGPDSDDDDDVGCPYRLLRLSLLTCRNARVFLKKNKCIYFVGCGWKSTLKKYNRSILSVSVYMSLMQRI